MAFNHDGSQLATAGGDGTARIWDPTNGEVMHWENLVSPVSSSCFDSYERVGLATGHLAGARVWQPNGGRGITKAGITTPGVTLDIPAGLSDDHLGFRADVDTFAALLADRETHQPLSIAFFGDWGTGKSSFLRMLQQRINELTRSNHPSFSRRVLHVEFIAWHYSDADLWLSLATHVWNRLAEDEGVRALMRADANRRLEGALIELNRHDKTVGREPGDEEAIGAFRELASAVGVADPTVRQVETWAGGARTLVTRPRELFRVLGTYPRRTAAAIVLVAIAIVLALFAVIVESVRVSLFAVVGMVAALFASVSVVINVTRPFAVKVKQTLNYLGEAERETRAHLVKQLETARNELEHLDQIGVASATGTNRRYADLAGAAGVADTYRSGLGVIHRVQRDFTQLVDLLASGEAEGETGTGAEVPAKIILYVDDLDRCQARRVVEILEAAHLLRDIFIVAVAVDPRWLERSLETQYADLLRPERPLSATMSGIPAKLATPRDHLEKIFQISFALGRMETTQFGTIVRTSLAAVETNGASLATTAEPEVENGLSKEHLVGRVKVGSGAPVVDGRVSVSTDSDSPRKAGAGYDEPTRFGQPQGAAPETVALVVEAITITDAEVRFLALLGPLIDTPRSARRLINAYRLVRACSRGLELERFREKDHRTAAILLAAALGYGEEARPTLERFVAGQAENWDTALSGCRPELREAFGLVWKAAADQQTPVPDDIEIAQKWTPVIRRFSLRTSPWTTSGIETEESSHDGLWD